MSERRPFKSLGQHRSTQRKTPQRRDEEAKLTAGIVSLARQYGRFGWSGMCRKMSAHDFRGAVLASSSN